MGVAGSFQDTKNLQEENRLLKARLAEMVFRAENYYREITISNQRLRRMLGFKLGQSYELLPVEVISYPPRSFFRAVFIGKGEKEGMKRNMVVTSAEGLVGRIVEVYPHQSKVLTILDELSRVGVMDQRTRDVAITYRNALFIRIPAKISCHVETLSVFSGNRML